MNREGNQTNKLLRKQWHRKEHKYYKNRSTKHIKEFERKVIAKKLFSLLTETGYTKKEWEWKRI